MNDIREWLIGLGLDAYVEVFEENEIDEEDLRELTHDDLKEEFGITRFKDRKKLLQAIAALGESTLQARLHTLPFAVAMPLREYVEETHPGMKLWAACDTVEMLLRFLVISTAADRRRLGTLDERTLRALWGRIELPTLGAWMAMARALAGGKRVESTLVPELSAYVEERLVPLLYGPDKPGTPETSLLRLRNRLAHGGGLPRKEAERLLAIWQGPFEQTLAAATWLAELTLVGRDDAERLMDMSGVSFRPAPEHEARLPEGAHHDDGVWLLRGDTALPLWPLVCFGHPCHGDQTRQEDVPQLYTRKEVVTLQFTPMGAEGFSQSEAGETAVEAFRRIFELDRAAREQTAKGYSVPGFENEIGRDARQMVGRVRELQHLRDMIEQRHGGLLWVTGVAGMGKSFLMARLAFDLAAAHANSPTLVLPYRFRAGDDARCRRDAFADYVQERLETTDALLPGSEEKKDKAEQRLEATLGRIRQDRQVILVLDGLDEIARKDAAFAEEIPCALRYPNLLWVCAGRPEGPLMKTMALYQAEQPFPDGLPPMRTEDIRGMLLDKIGPLRRRLLRKDREQGDAVINPFITQVEQRAAGLPLYVKYVIGDVLSGDDSVLDRPEKLPESLHAYHEKLIQRLGIGDLQAVVTPLAATLAAAHEPLAEHEIATFLRMRSVLPPDDVGERLLRQGLAAIASMLRTAPDPEGEEGYTLFHNSLRDHILGAETMRGSVRMARDAFAQAALDPDPEAGVANYLIRAGVDHLLDAGMTDQAAELLLDLERLGRMGRLGRGAMDVFGYWRRIGGGDRSRDYLRLIEAVGVGGLDEDGLRTARFIGRICRTAGWRSAHVDLNRAILAQHEIVSYGECEFASSERLEYYLGKARGDLAEALSAVRQFQEALDLAQLRLEAQTRTLGGEHPITVDSLNDLGSLLRDKGDLEAAETLLRQALERSERALGPDHPTTLGSVSKLGRILLNKGDLEAAEPVLGRAMAASKRTLGQDDPTTQDRIMDWGALLLWKGEFDLSESLFRGALETSERTFGPEHVRTLSIVSNLSFVMRYRGDLKATEPLLRRALESQERTLGPDHPDTLMSVNNLCLLLRDKGELEAAETMYRRVLEARERTLGPDHPETLISVNNLGSLLQDEGEPEAAETMYRRALRAGERTLGPDHPDTLMSVNNLGSLLQDKGDLEAAETMYRRALEVRECSLGPDHPDTLDSAAQLGHLLYENGDIKAAEPLTRRVLEYDERTLGPDHPSTLRCVSNLAYLLHKKGDFEGAESMARRATATSERTLGPNHPDTVRSLNFLGFVLLCRGKFCAAGPLLRHALEASGRYIGFDHPDTLNVKGNLARTLGALDRFDEAITLFQDVIERKRLHMGEDHPSTSSSRYYYADLLERMGRYSDARDQFRTAARHRVERLGEAHPDTLASMLGHARTALALNELDEARQTAEELLRAASSSEGPAALTAYRARAILARVLVASGEQEAGEREAREALAGLEAAGEQEEAEAMRELLGER